MTDEYQTLEFTGERFIPGNHGNIEIEHLHRYLQACEITNGKIVLDIASGEGYGSAMLARKAHKVIGVDISIAAVEHARNRYKVDNLDYIQGSCSNIPLPDASVDAVISFETIEHHDQHEKMMSEIKRVLRPNGFLLISSPDKYYYSDLPQSTNEYHVKELYEREFKTLIGKFFKNSTYFGQRIIYGSGIFSEFLPSLITSYWRENEVINESLGIAKPLYWIAIASDEQLPELSSGLLEQAIDTSEVVQSWGKAVADRESKINNLQNIVTNLQSIVDERDKTVASLMTSKSWKLTKPLRLISRWMLSK